MVSHVISDKENIVMQRQFEQELNFVTFRLLVFLLAI
jgi:hypothetical protein